MEEDRLTVLRRAAALAAAAVVVGAELAAPAGAPWLSVLDAAVGVAFAGGAAAVARVSGRTADPALAVAILWGLGTLAAGGDLPAELILLHRAPLTLLVLTYPGRRLRSALGRTIALAALAAPFGPAGVRAGASAGVAWAAALVTAADAARTAPVLRPPRALAALAGAAVAAAATAGAAELGDATVLLAAYDAVLLAIAVGLLGPLSRRRWSAVAATGLVVELGAGPPGAPVTAGLAEVLRDPGLELRLRTPGGSWTDEAGRPAPDPAERAARTVTRRMFPDGTELALVHDSAAIADEAAAGSAVAVAAAAIENARHQREVRERIEHLRGLRRAVIAAADEERRLLEDELRVGPLREAALLDELLRGVSGERAEALRRELAVVRAELTEIARGLYPAALARDGLTASLTAMARRVPFPVAFEGRLDAAIPEPVALTAYYVASEALANVAKHARAPSARIELDARDSVLIVRVLDDGAGGADPSGRGLRGLRDRVTAVDGVLRVVSPPGGGTVVEARLPLRTTKRDGGGAA